MHKNLSVGVISHNVLFEKYEKECNMIKIILVGFCPLTIKITQSPSTLLLS